MRENFPFDTAEEFLEYFEVEEKLRTMSNNKEIAILKPAMPDIAREDILSLSQAIVVVLVSFIPGMSDTQQIALYGLSAAIALCISGGGASRRKWRNERIAAENSLLIEAQTVHGE